MAAVVIVASRYGLPMSSTPATVGAIAGVGLLEGRSGFNTRLFLKFCAGWVITIVATVLLSCAFMAQGLYSPNKSWCGTGGGASGRVMSTAAAAATALAGLLGSGGSSRRGAATGSLARLQLAHSSPPTGLPLSPAAPPSVPMWALT